MVPNTIAVQLLVTYVTVGSLLMSLLVFVIEDHRLVLLHLFYALTG